MVRGTVQAAIQYGPQERGPDGATPRQGYTARDRRLATSDDSQPSMGHMPVDPGFTH